MTRLVASLSGVPIAGSFAGDRSSLMARGDRSDACQGMTSSLDGDDRQVQDDPGRGGQQDRRPGHVEAQRTRALHDDTTEDVVGTPEILAHDRADEAERAADLSAVKKYGSALGNRSTRRIVHSEVAYERSSSSAAGSTWVSPRVTLTMTGKNTSTRHDHHLRQLG